VVPFVSQLKTDQEDVIGIHRQYLNRRAPDRRSTDNLRTFEPEVVPPNIRSQCEVISHRLAAVLLGDDMVYLKWCSKATAASGGAQEPSSPGLHNS
jgi:hypothetical protein